MNYENPHLPYYLALDAFPKFGPVRSRKLAAAFSGPEQAFKATLQELVMAGIEPKIAEEFCVFRPSVNPEKILGDIIKEDIKVVFVFENDFPAKLKEIYDPPFLLYYKGKLQNIAYPLAVVGTRKYSRYGQEVTKKLVTELAQAGLGIISGLAHGIDCLAHEAALEAHGLTWGVLGTGLDRGSIYPASNRYLADKILSSEGCLLSEFKPGTSGLPHHFPIRNRIVAGLSFGTLIIEAALKSGSLITAQLTLDYGREVLAVPGPINSPQSEGTNLLLKQGARPVTQAQDILELLDLKSLTSYSNKNRNYEPISELEKNILSSLSSESLHINELVRISGQTVSCLQGQLLLLEMKGVVKNLGNMEYIKL